MVKLLKQLPILVAFIAGSIISITVTQISAHNGDSTLVHACIKSNGNINIVSPTSNCSSGETAVDWRKFEPGEGSFPLICMSCNFNQTGGIGSRLSNKDLSGAIFSNSSINGDSNQIPNLTGVILDRANLIFMQITQVNLANAKIRNADASNSVINNTNLSGADLSNSNFTSGAFVGSDFTNTNLTNANLTNTQMNEATNMSSANISGVIWSNTTCPDGTNSDNNGSTCIGHF